MTEIPEHLLRRSRERREALGLGGGGTPPPADEGGAPADGGTAEPSAAAPVPAAAPAAPAIPEIPPPPPPPPYVAEVERQRVPYWVMPVLLILPFWAILYFGAFGSRETAEAAAPDGAALYATNCASCHGQSGEGAGDFPALNNGSTKLTFPDVADHESWVRTGSGPFAGQPYGDPNREGGQRGPARGVMPAFGSLSDAEIAAVVAYERDEL